MTAPSPVDAIVELDKAEEPADFAGEEAQTREVDQATGRDELELPPELMGVPFS
jgi:hypothetical protein